MYDSSIRSVILLFYCFKNKIASEIKLLLMKRVKGDYWCHVAGKVEQKGPCQAILREIIDEMAIQPQRLDGFCIEQFYSQSLNVIEMIPHLLASGVHLRKSICSIESWIAY